MKPLGAVLVPTRPIATTLPIFDGDDRATAFMGGSDANYPTDRRPRTRQAARRGRASFLKATPEHPIIYATGLVELERQSLCGCRNEVGAAAEGPSRRPWPRLRRISYPPSGRRSPRRRDAAGARRAEVADGTCRARFPRGRSGARGRV